MLQDVTLEELIGHDILGRAGIRWRLDSRVSGSEHMFYLIGMDHVRTIKEDRALIMQGTHPADCHRCAIEVQFQTVIRENLKEVTPYE